MKKLILIFICLFSLNCITHAQQINGVILSDTGNLKVVKTWGTHYQRGFAYGYLCKNNIMSVWNNFVLPGFGNYLPMAKAIIGNENYFHIDSVYVVEAKAILDGLGAAGADTAGLSYMDLFVVNFLTDLQGFMPKSLPSQNCSSLLDWGDATLGTDLNGKSVITHHLDADQYDTALFNNQVLVIHIPSETDEQPWLLTGTAGQFVASQAINKSGLCVFLNTVNGFSAELNKHYEPVTLNIRKSVERKDFNGDAATNVDDVLDAINSNTNGYASGFIVCAIAPSTLITDSLIATVAELTPQAPYITKRNISFPDSVAGDNLYAANSMIARNTAYDFCSRYNAVSAEINTNYSGQNIGSADNWNIMAAKSTQTSNLQAIQVIPEDNVLKISVRDTVHPAYELAPMVFDLEDFFSEPPSGINNQHILNNFQVITYPNPFQNSLTIELPENDNKIYFEILDMQACKKYSAFFNSKVNLNLSDYSSGVYFLRIYLNQTVIVRKIIKL